MVKPPTSKDALEPLPARLAELERQLARVSAEGSLCRAIERSTRGGSTAVDPQGRLIYVNAAFCEMVGWTEQELLGRSPPFPYWAPESVERIGRSMREAIAGRDPDRAIEAVYLRRSGERLRVEIEVSPLLDDHGAKLGWLTTIRDVTRQRRAEEELRQLRQAVETSGEVIFLTDIEGVIRYVNPEFTRLYGWTREEVVGKVTPRVLKSGQLEPERYEAFWRRLLADQVNRGEIMNRRKDGTLVRVDGSASPIHDERGGIVGFLAIQRDVSERTQMQEQLLQAQKMEAVGRLAGGIAHDFNNLLSVILNYAGFVLEAVDPNDPLHQDVEEIRRAGQRATALTSQLLAFSRGHKVDPHVLDLNTVVSHMGKLLHRTLGEDVAIAFDPAPDLPRIKADPGQVEQVILNLANNARDAMPGGGQIAIATGAVELDAEAARRAGDVAPGSYVLLEVTDTGDGMTPEVLARAFDPFFTTKPAGQGTGLGLSIVYGIVQQLGGHVRVRSSSGAGTSFSLYLPATTETNGAPAPVETVGQRGHGETVLLIEDEDAVRELTRRILTRSGYRVLDARNAGEALLLCEQRDLSIDLLLSDVVMPKVSGPEIARRLLQIRPELRVLFMSGYADPVDQNVVRSMSAGFIAKPFTRDELLDAVGKLVAAR